MSQRPSPTPSAIEFPIGTKRRGNDGDMWIVAVAGKTQRWVKHIKSADLSEHKIPVARKSTEPKLIIVKTLYGYGSPEIEKLKAALGRSVAFFDTNDLEREIIRKHLFKPQNDPRKFMQNIQKSVRSGIAAVISMSQKSRRFDTIIITVPEIIDDIPKTAEKIFLQTTPQYIASVSSFSKNNRNRLNQLLNQFRDHKMLRWREHIGAWALAKLMLKSPLLIKKHEDEKKREYKTAGYSVMKLAELLKHIKSVASKN